MYERNAIVLERYFYGVFDFKNSSNLRENYYNYRKLFECYGNLYDAREKERVSKEEFDVVSKEISKIQKTQEKLYNEAAKFEYSRYIIFSNTSEAAENIEKHLEKVNNDVQKNIDELKELGQKFVQAIADYNEKENALKEATAQREKAENEYNEIYENAKVCYGGITEEKIKEVEEFLRSENKEMKKELQETFEENGKNEKNQFDQDVIQNTINKSVEIYKGEMDVYLAGYDRIAKLFEEIETDTVKLDKHTKYYRDSNAKVSFLNAEKEYIIQFLDNERIGAIYDKKVHRKLMLEACKKFVLDFAQIDSLYEIILKEVAGRSTKKIYKENYNKEYLIELENASIEPSLDTGKMRQEAIAFMNLNYWRIEGIRSIYNTFEEIVTTIYGKDLSEFVSEELKPQEEMAEQVVEASEISNETEAEAVEIEDIEEATQELEEKVVLQEKVKPRRVYYSSKTSLANAIYHSLQTNEFANSEDADEVEEYSEDEKYSIPDNVKEILANAGEFDMSEEAEEEDDTEIVKDVEDEQIEVEERDNESAFDLSKIDDIEDEEDTVYSAAVEEDEEYEEDEEIEVEDEDSILEVYFSDDENEKNKSLESSVTKKVGFFKKLVGFNSKEKKKA